jgi:hypothetical protein
MICAGLVSERKGKRRGRRSEPVQSPERISITFSSKFQSKQRTSVEFLRFCQPTHTIPLLLNIASSVSTNLRASNNPGGHSLSDRKYSDFKGLQKEVVLISPRLQVEKKHIAER